jgi:hypothetical protein
MTGMDSPVLGERQALAMKCCLRMDVVLRKW